MNKILFWAHIFLVMMIFVLSLIIIMGLSSKKITDEQLMEKYNCLKSAYALGDHEVIYDWFGKPYIYRQINNHSVKIYLEGCE